MDPMTDASSKIKKSSSSRRRRASRASAASSAEDAEAPAEESSLQTGNLSRREKAKAKLRSRRLPSSKDVAQSPTAEEGLPSPVQSNTAGGAKEASQGKEDTHTGQEGLGAPLQGTQTALPMPADHGAVADHVSGNSSTLPAVPFKLPPKVAVDEAAPLFPSAPGQNDSTALVTTLQESQKRSSGCFGTFRPTATPSSSHAVRSKTPPPIARAFAPCTEMAVQDSSTSAHGFQRLYRIDPNGAVGGSWASALWTDAVGQKARCLHHQHPGTSHDEDLFPEVPALEVAHSALLSALAVERFVRTTADWSEEQAFFVAVCHGMCHPARRVTGVVAGSDCNKAMRNFPAFAAVFGCREGLPTNPALKCSFFH